VALAAALVGAPEVLVLDEPTNGLDLGALGDVQQILEAQASRGGAVLFATHDNAFVSRLEARVIDLGAIPPA
jgi:ATPase subunit of ABC transporter with duplicated ATPase domains